MKSRIATAAVASVFALLTTGVVSAAPADAARCVSGADVRGQVAAFVHSLRDDVALTAARKATKHALVESVKAARGAKADTPEERRGLGEEISALARQLKDATNNVERKALIAQIHALQLEKRESRTTHEDVKALKSDVRALGRAIAKKTDTHGEGRQVAAFVHDLMAQFAC
jgi:hypothetical protein